MRVAAVAIMLGAVPLAACNTMSDSPAGVRTLLVDDQFQYLNIATLVRAYANSMSCSELAVAQPADAEAVPAPQKEYYPLRSRHEILTGSDLQDKQTAEAAALFYDRCYSVGVASQNPSPLSGVKAPPTGDQVEGSDKGNAGSGSAGTGNGSTPDNPPLSPLQKRAALLRNDIQDSIIAAANQRCHRWKSYFSTQSAAVGFWAKTTGTVTSALATAFSPPGTKSGLSAASTISGGLDANYTEKYLQQKTTSVIFQGIDTRRSNLLTSITDKRFRSDGSLKPLESYTLSLAIADALEYHAACSVESGLQQAGEALTQQQPQDSNPAAQKGANNHTGNDAGQTQPREAGRPGDQPAAGSGQARQAAPTQQPEAPKIEPRCRPLTKSPVNSGAPDPCL